MKQGRARRDGLKKIGVKLMKVQEKVGLEGRLDWTEGWTRGNNGLE